ncbi:MAG TPA: acyl-CoA carboxylase subunit epsilon [Sporichthya sp.]|nr:acyl-CoA carboxylase subunit epsilon [Sporichthya sp.]
MSPEPQPDDTPRPILRVVRGEPDDAELAALIAVVSARAAAAPAEAEPEPNAWTDRSRLVRRELPHGPGAWRASAWRS